jgi:threonyl-tRNA synthetase
MKDISKIEKMRHTASHVLAQAVLKLYPDTKLGIGPAIENGFYYDFDFVEPITEKDLSRIESEMKKIAKQKLPLTQTFMSRKDAEEYLKNIEQEYKLELFKEIPDEEVSFFVTGDNEFIDMCRGPHMENTGQIGYFRLLKTAGAYWRGDEKRKMLTRIYGVSFETKEELKEHLLNLEEQKKESQSTWKTA